MTDENLKYKTGLRRLGATIIDILVFIPLFFADDFVRNNLDNKVCLFIWLCIYITIPYFYTVFMHFKYGQTFGKMAVNIKVLTLDETKNLSIRAALFRDSFFMIVDTLGLIYFANQIMKSSISITESLDNFDNFVGNVALFWILVELLSMFTNAKRRAIHDFIAGSVVIKLKP